MTVKYSELAINDKFIYNGKIYQKVKAVKKNCCQTLYNSILVEDPNQKIVVPPKSEVVKVEE